MTQPGGTSRSSDDSNVAPEPISSVSLFGGGLIQAATGKSGGLGRYVVGWMVARMPCFRAKDLDPGLRNDGHGGGPGRTWNRTC